MPEFQETDPHDEFDTSRIPKLIVPNKWEGALTEEQLAKFDPAYRPILFAMARIESKVDFCIEWLELTNRHQRALESRQIRQTSWKWRIMKWGGATALAGALAAVGKKTLDRLWP